MNYEAFRKLIEKKTKITQEDYEKMTRRYGGKIIAEMFEKYLNDESVKEDQLKFDRTSYYVELTSKDTESLKTENAQGDIYSEDMLRMYLKEISSSEVLSPEEEIELFSEVQAGRDYIKSIDFNYDNVLEYLKTIGFTALNSNKVYEAEDGVEYLKQYISTLDINSTEEIAFNNKVLEELYKYSEYLKVRNKFVDCNLKLVVATAKRYANKGLDYVDLVQEGNIGLMRAIEKFDVNMGNKFSTYAVWWIRQSITRGIADKARTIRLPVHVIEKYLKITAFEKALAEKLNRVPTDEEVVENYRQMVINNLKAEGHKNPTNTQINSRALTLESYKSIKEYGLTPTSLSKPVGDEGDSTLEEFIPDSKFEDGKTERQMAYEDVFKAVLPTLSPREQVILAARFGLKFDEYIPFDVFTDCLRSYNKYNHVGYDKKYIFDFYSQLDKTEEEHTLDYCGRKLGITRERVRQIEASALRKLRFKPEVRALRDQDEPYVFTPKTKKLHRYVSQNKRKK